uniref:carnosine N-methyltransferase n=1 Tax=Kwoniella dejecticola CBS 10117 TaxID=1296121 RepID=A0A1A5ZWD7_9TREE|nr:uncharacterized protein I303_08039 [Kwoniella dejecticola CBS 10117]OBR82125.1 hypothetical protein I303_08039 [Kwoniella dejecticola CBS 10117]
MSDSPEEREHWRSVIRAFDGYMRYHLSANHARRMSFLSLPKDSKELYGAIGYREKLDAVDEGIRRNAEFIDEMIGSPVFADMLQPDNIPHAHSHSPSNTHDHSHDHSDHHSHTHDAEQPLNDGSNDGADERPRSSPSPSSSQKKQHESDSAQDKIRSTLRSFVRDWSVEGRKEREACYDPCLEALERYYPSTRAKRERGSVRVLVPGCGLGRLAMKIAARGFASQGNEFSSYMLIASDWVLNHTTKRDSHTIYPYLHSFSNHLSTMHNLLRSVQIPDICPADVLGNGQGGDFSLVAGDFEEIYGPASWKVPSSTTDKGREEDEGDDQICQKGRWGAVVTCFFIDCARNVLNYLRIIHTILADDGVWINVGPLLWHFENSPKKSPTGEGSIELSLDEVKDLARLVGFDIKEEKMVRSTYTGIPDGMLKHEYNAAFWVATKRKTEPLTQ